MNHCPHCGERVEPRDAYCFECGERLSGRQSGAAPRGRPRESGRHQRKKSGHNRSGRVQSLTTLWVAAGLAALALVESLGAILFADELVALVEDSEFRVEVSAETIVVSGGVGLVVAIGLSGLCAYYYRQGYVGRRFFWGLIAGGGIGILLGNAISFLILVVVGAYGLLVVVRRNRPEERPSRV